MNGHQNSSPSAVSPASKQRVPRPGRRGTIVAIAALVLLWLLAMLFRMELRAQWWAYRLTRVESREARNYYLARLAAVGDKSVGALGRVLCDPRPEIREMGVTVLQYCPGTRARGMLLDMLPDENDDVAGKAALGLASRKDASALLATLGELIRGPDVAAARAAAVALERMPDREADRIFIEALEKAAEADLRAQIIDSLAMRRSEAAVPLLTEMLADQRPVATLPYSRRSALRALGAVQGQLLSRGIDPHSGVEALQAERTVSAIAARAIQMITGPGSGHRATQPAATRRASECR